jgi:hypothetical protein
MDQVQEEMVVVVSHQIYLVLADVLEVVLEYKELLVEMLMVLVLGEVLVGVTVEEVVMVVD